MGSAASIAGHRADDLARITPELVLVDPELSGRVRHRVPLPFLRRTPPLPVLHRASEPGRPVPDAAELPVG